MIRCLTFLICFLPAFIWALDETLPVEAPESAPEADDPEKLSEMIDTLNQASLQEAFRLLTSDYINGEELDSLEVNRSALQGMLSRLDFGAMLLTEKAVQESNSRFVFHAEKINRSTAYLRFGRYNKSGLKEMDAALKTFIAEKAITDLIVDLRSPQAQAEFAIASEILSRFRPPNELLFKIRRPGADRPTLFVSKSSGPNWSRNLILLVDRETGNVGEIIAAVLKRKSAPLIIGETTPGLTVEYRDVPIGEDRIMRYAIAEVVLDDDSSIFRKGIEPDIETPTPKESKHAIFDATQKDRSLTDFLYQKQRPRMNEAALVAGIDPEIDYYILRTNGKPTPWDKPPLQDRALQQAVDLLNANSFLESGRKTRR
ncbi:MAG: S41 family peptidase [Verrucomicrobiales bacterium]|nr:S41 family peptidase [Verrucomicrobiales bacterium]